MSNEEEEFSGEESEEYDDYVSNIKREDVLEQLQELGYKNIPDELVEEFLQELRLSSARKKEQPTSTTQHTVNKKQPTFAPSKTTNQPPPTKNTTIPSHTKEEETDEEEEDQEQNQQFEEEEDSLLLHNNQDAFVKNQKVIEKSKPFQYTSTMTATPPKLVFDNKDIPVRRASSAKTVQVKSNAEALAAATTNNNTQDRLKMERQYLLEQQAKLDAQLKTQQETMKQLKHKLKGVQQAALAMRPSSAGGNSTQEGGSVSNSPRPKSSLIHSNNFRMAQTYRKKLHDPVSRYQQMSNVWKKDSFLRNSSNNHKDLRWQVRQEMLLISGDTSTSSNL